MNNRGIILLEVLLALTILCFALAEVSRIFSIALQQKVRFESQYLQMYRSRQLLYNAVATHETLDNPFLEYKLIAPALTQITDKQTGFRVYRFD